MDDAKNELLGRVLDEVARNGLADRSLRELATAVGTSHRMLLYHFGSREGLVTAIVQAVEAGQRAATHALADAAHDPSDVMRGLWQQVADPSLRPFVQLFFEAVTYASRAGTAADFTGPWVEEGGAMAERLGAENDPVAIRLGVAVTRGLLVDAITGHAEDAAAAYDLFVRMWEREAAARATPVVPVTERRHRTIAAPRRTPARPTHEG